MLHFTHRRMTALIGASIIMAGASAQDFASGKLNYEILSEDDMTVAIAEGDDYYEGLTTADLPEQVTHEGRTYTVVAIGDYALNGATFDGDIVLPSTITSIGEYAMQECEGAKVTLPAGLTDCDPSAFATCIISEFEIAESNTLFTTVDGVLLSKDRTTIVCYPALRPGAWYVIPPYVTTIGSYAFRAGDEYLEEVVFHPGMTVMAWAFQNNGNILRLNLPGDIVLEHNAFMGCEAVTDLVLGEGMKTIAEYAFFDLCSLEEVRLPKSLETIEKNAFGFCEKLKSVSFPPNLKKIGDSAFSDCFSLQDIDFGQVSEIGKFCFARTPLVEAELTNVENVAGSAFASCPSLEKVSFPAARTLGESMFFRCPSLKEVIFGSEVEEIGGTFFYECGAIEKFEIPASVSAMGAGVLTGTYAMTRVTAADGNNSFACVDNIVYDKDMTRVLTAPCGIADWTVKLPEGVSVIGAMAFRKCAGMVAVELPGTVTEIENLAFADCTGLKEVVSLNPVPPVGGIFPDGVYAEAKLVVADEEALAAYGADENWGKFANREVAPKVGLETLSGQKIVDTRYYDLNGHAITMPATGVYIEKTLHSDGTVTVAKKVK